MIYDHTNMWANVQHTAQPWDMAWKLTEYNQWRAFFGLYLRPRELATVQVWACRVCMVASHILG